MPRTTMAADSVTVLDSVDSTNAFARHMLSAGDLGSVLARRAAGSCLAVVAADEQTGGHGRLGRAWVSRRGESFTTSFVGVMPAGLAADASMNGWLPMVAGLAALDALHGTFAEYGASAIGGDCTLSLKWPNDIYCDGLKLGGILTELVLPRAAALTPGEAAPNDSRGDSDATGGVFVVFGIGMNLGLRAEQLPTPESTSLQLHVQPLPPFELLRDGIAARITVSLRRRLTQFAKNPQEQSARLLNEVAGVCWTLGRNVRARIVGGAVVEGRAVSLNADASITIEDGAGEQHVVRTGDVGVLA